MDALRASTRLFAMLEHLRACRDYIAQNPKKARLPEGTFVLGGVLALVKR